MENGNKLYRFLKLGIFCFIILSIGWVIIQVMVVQGRARNQEKEKVINRIQNELNLFHILNEVDSEEELKERYIKSVYSAQEKLKEEGIEFYSVLNRLEKRYQENEVQEIAGLTGYLEVKIYDEISLKKYKNKGKLIPSDTKVIALDDFFSEEAQKEIAKYKYELELLEENEFGDQKIRVHIVGKYKDGRICPDAIQLLWEGNHFWGNASNRQKSEGYFREEGEYISLIDEESTKADYQWEEYSVMATIPSDKGQKEGEDEKSLPIEDEKAIYLVDYYENYVVGGSSKSFEGDGTVVPDSVRYNYYSLINQSSTNPAKQMYEKCLDGSESTCQGAKKDFYRLAVMDVHGEVMIFDWGEPGVSYQADYVFYYPTAKIIAKDYMGLFIRLAIAGLFLCVVFNSLIHWVQKRQKTMEENRKNMTRAIAHELKTPLAVMKNYLEMLQEESEPEKRQSYQEIMEEEIGHMDTLVLDMLELSRLEAGVRKLEQEEVELISLTRGLLQRMQGILKEKRLRVTIQTYPEADQEEMIVKGDIRGLQMMVNNYLTNAIKNTSDGKTIQIRMKDEGKTIRYEVYNQGPQLSKSEQKRIWVSFYKNDCARTRHFGSSGLGLAIVKMMAKEMKGKTGCHTEEKGMNFWFTCRKY